MSVELIHLGSSTAYGKGLCVLVDDLVRFLQLQLRLDTLRLNFLRDTIRLHFSRDSIHISTWVFHFKAPLRNAPFSLSFSIELDFAPVIIT